MAVISGWWPSVNGDRKYYIEQQAAVNAQLYSNGVLPVGKQFQVVVDSGLTLHVTAGFAWINGHWIYNDADYTLVLDAPDGVLGRVDRVILKWHRENRETTIEIKKGTAASAPVGADLQRDADAFELCLADVLLAAGVTSVTQSAVTDTRPDAALCGFSAVYDPPVATEWFAQFEASFNEWFDNVKGILEGDTAGALTAAVATLQQDVTSLETAFTAKIALKADKSATATATFLADGWGDAAPYQQTVEVAELAYGVDGTKPNGFAEWVHSTDADTEDALAKAWGFISYFEQGDGTMTAVCLKKVPTVDLPFEVLIVG